MMLHPDFIHMLEEDNSYFSKGFLVVELISSFLQGFLGNSNQIILSTIDLKLLIQLGN